MNGMELTNMMSAHIIPFWYRLSIPCDIASRCDVVVIALSSLSVLQHQVQKYPRLPRYHPC